MYTLEEHIDGEYRDRHAQLQVVTRLVQRTVPLFGDNQIFSTDWGWAYEMKSGPEVQPPKKYSHSTNAMIAWALIVLDSATSSRVLAPVPLAPHVTNEFWRVAARCLDEKGKATDCREQITIRTKEGLELLVSKLARSLEEGQRGCLTRSKTFGADDPMTLAWLFDLRTVLKDAESDGGRASKSHSSEESERKVNGGSDPTVESESSWKVLDRVRCVAIEELTTIAALLKGDHEAGDGDMLRPHSGKRATDKAWDGERFRNAFWVLRYAHLAEMLRESPREENGTKEIPDIGRLAQVHFSSRFNEHMAAVGTTSFDPAEFVFALEGLVRWAPQPPRRKTLERVFETLREAQATSAYWRPTRPVVTTPQGQVLFPLSVEIANSLLRTMYWLDQEDPRREVFHTNLDLFTEYVDWLESQLSKVGSAESNAGSRTYFGWHSEYDPSREAIHTWQTSQVLAFLAQFAALLQLNIERRLREAGRFDVSPSRWMQPDPPNSEEDRLEQVRRWDKWLVENEPIRPNGAASSLPDGYTPSVDPWTDGGAESPYQVLRRMRRDFVVPAAQNSPEAFSFALYGPPGTGKTTQVEALRRVLGLPLVKLTTSDFVMGGEGEVEARAKAIFEALEEQSNAIIFFDELDRLVLDRTSRGYSRQSDLFQFMTPGMLTKLQDLRDRERCIFALATNHHERIDSAIKRVGRIDKQYLLLPPNRAQREVWLRCFLRERAEKAEVEFVETEFNASVGKAASSTPWFVWNELRQVVRDAWSQANPDGKPAEILSSLVVVAKAERPAISLSRYNSSFRGLEPDFQWNQEPWEEVLLLVHLLSEGPDGEIKLPRDDPRFARETQWLSNLVKKCPERKDRGLEEINDAIVRDEVEQALESLAS